MRRGGVEPGFKVMEGAVSGTKVEMTAEEGCLWMVDWAFARWNGRQCFRKEIPLSRRGFAKYIRCCKFQDYAYVGKKVQKINNY